MVLGWNGVEWVGVEPPRGECVEPETDRAELGVGSWELGECWSWVKGEKRREFVFFGVLELGRSGRERTELGRTTVFLCGEKFFCDRRVGSCLWCGCMWESFFLGKGWCVEWELWVVWMRIDFFFLNLRTTGGRRGRESTQGSREGMWSW